jgi:hypothetical protein
MIRDLAALERAEIAFTERYEDEARARWRALGAPDVPELRDAQLAVINATGPTEELWRALAWELDLRIDLLDDARQDLKRKDSETG